MPQRECANDSSSGLSVMVKFQSAGCFTTAGLRCVSRQRQRATAQLPTSRTSQWLRQSGTSCFTDVSKTAPQRRHVHPERLEEIRQFTCGIFNTTISKNEYETFPLASDVSEIFWYIKLTFSTWLHRNNYWILLIQLLLMYSKLWTWQDCEKK